MGADGFLWLRWGAGTSGGQENKVIRGIDGSAGFRMREWRE